MKSVRRLAGLAGVIAVVALSVVVWPGRGAGAATTSPGPPVTYYVVHDPHHLQTDFLRLVASRTLGNANRYTEIFKLNVGRLQPDGKRMESGSTVEPGWVLELPQDAHGPLVHHGSLPGSGAQPQPRHRALASPSPSPNRPVARAVSETGAVVSGDWAPAELAGILAALCVAAALVTFVVSPRMSRGRAEHSDW
jgi:hypothetical protein